MTRRALVAGAASAACVVTLFAAPGAQAAAGDDSWVYGGYNVRTCSSTACPSLGLTAYSQWDQTWCWQDGQWQQGTNRWFEVTSWVTSSTWQTGFVIAAALPNSLQASVPGCP